ncbi:hypothetical protein Ccrd_026888, partial [Cynara cardunculus var. scolymus]
MSPKESKWPFKLNPRQISLGQFVSRIGLYLPKQLYIHGQLYLVVSRVTSHIRLTIINANEEMEDRTLIKILSTMKCPITFIHPPNRQ